MHGLADYWIYSFAWQPDGNQWIGTWAGANSVDLATMEFKTYFSELINEWVYALDIDSKDRVWFGTEGGISLYDGETWRELTEGLPEEIMAKTGLAISPQKPDVIYATIELANRTGAMYRSEDGGESWVKGADYAPGGTGPHYYNELWASPHQFDRVYAVDVLIHVTDDGGRNFRPLNTRNKHVDNHAIAFFCGEPNHVLIGCDGGLYESWDRGDTYTKINNLPLAQAFGEEPAKPSDEEVLESLDRLGGKTAGHDHHRKPGRRHVVGGPDSGPGREPEGARKGRPPRARSQRRSRCGRPGPRRRTGSRRGARPYGGASAPGRGPDRRPGGRAGATARAGLLFPLVGIFLLKKAWDLTREWRRFGVIELEMDPFPGAIGGHVGGRLLIQGTYQGDSEYHVELACVRSYVSGSGKNRSRRESVLWSETGTARSTITASPKGMGTRLSFRFDVPDNLPESDISQSGDYYLWRIRLTAEIPGTNLDRDYSIPVFRTEIMSPFRDAMGFINGKQ